MERILASGKVRKAVDFQIALLFCFSTKSMIVLVVTVQVRKIGVSNYPASLLSEMAEYAKVCQKILLNSLHDQQIYM